MMFETPGRDDVRKVVIDAEVIDGKERPHIFKEDGARLEWLDNGTLKPAA